MNKLIRAAQPCPCGQSSDAYHYYTDGEWCFSCGHGKRIKDNPRKGGNEAAKVNWMAEEEFYYSFAGHRGLSIDTMKMYNAKTKFKAEGDVPLAILFPTVFPAKGGKVRYLDEKRFITVGENPEKKLFGQEAFPVGCSDTITITEGEFDAMAVHQIVGRPAVSIFGAASARKDLKTQYEYIDSFKKIVICFDTDAAGQKALESVTGLFNFNKVFVVSMSPAMKDANGYLLAGKEDEFRRLWWNAKKLLPHGVMSTMSEFEEALDNDAFQKPFCSFPWPEVQDMLLGIRPGEVTLLTAPEGIGKTELVRAVEYHFLRETEYNLGIVHLEENKSRTLKGLVGLHLREPIHLPDCAVPREKIIGSLKDLVKRDDRLHVYSHFGGDDADHIVDTMRFLASAGECKLLTLDHITMMATGKEEMDERKYLDYLSQKLAALTQELGFHLLLVSHVNDDGQTRGSRNISKVAHNRIDIFRDITNADEIVRNTTTLTISKNRPASLTGPAGSLYFNRETFTLETELPEIVAEELPV